MAVTEAMIAVGRCRGSDPMTPFGSEEAEGTDVAVVTGSAEVLCVAELE
jgi:hypothetical protein